jgi:hypothetical protein
MGLRVTLALVAAAGALVSATPATAALRVPARVQGLRLAVDVHGRYETRFWAGVNLGSTVPGTLPGQVAATRADYDRWLPEIASLGATVIRVYTILRPAFYEALRAYDVAHPAAPLRLIQGVWIPEEQFLRTGDAYNPAVTNGFKSELHDAVAVVHGATRLPLRPGHAGGSFRSDVSPWLLAYSIGVEWDPFATESTIRKHRGVKPFRGRYFRAGRRANAMESWLASMLDWTARQEAARGTSVPLTFTNWLTADPLHHPTEPLPREDMVSIDATHIAATRAWPGGFFASYHAYPYYPDFLSREPALQRYHRPWDGKRDPYAGYLAELRRHHGKQAVMITELGVPTSIGLAHRGPLGRDQGGHSEREAGDIDVQLLEDVRHEGMAGGVLFEWADEWFKFTWNTLDIELAGRRQLWLSQFTNEEHFGVIATEPGTHPVVRLDGRDGEWKRNASQVIAESRGAVREVRAVKDAEYLYLRVLLDHANAWRTRPLELGFDVRPGGGDEVRLQVGPGDHARARWAARNDAFSALYGRQLHYVPVPRPGSRVDPRLMLDRPYPGSPAQFADLAALRFGPESADQRNLVDAHGQVLELRIPWSYLEFSDPSSRTVLAVRPNGSIGTTTIARVGIRVGGLRTRGYSWDPWNRATWHERRKASWPALRAEFVRLADA